jgi:acyl-CoA synthetase (AMP-forming)/AMP-acid ligase II
MSPEPMRFADLDQLADHHAARWREALAPDGAGVALIVAPTARSFAAIVGATRAGLALSLAPPEFETAELSAAVVSSNASIVAGPTEFAGISILERLRQVGIDHERIALVGTHGGRAAGIFELDGPRESDGIYPPRYAFAPLRFASGDGAVALLEEDELIDAAAAIVSRARIAPGDTIVTTLSCASAAGLAAGPLAALAGGASLVFHAPFEARGFLAALEAAAPAHVVIPEALAPAFKAAEATSRVASLILSCANGSAAQATVGASDGAPTVLVKAQAWGGISVDAEPAAGEGPDGRAA